jgi:hypothetical protein
MVECNILFTYLVAGIVPDRCFCFRAQCVNGNLCTGGALLSLRVSASVPSALMVTCIFPSSMASWKERMMLSPDTAALCIVYEQSVENEISSESGSYSGFKRFTMKFAVLTLALFAPSQTGSEKDI